MQQVSRAKFTVSVISGAVLSLFLSWLIVFGWIMAAYCGYISFRGRYKVKFMPKLTAYSSLLLGMKIGSLFPAFVISAVLFSGTGLAGILSLPFLFLFLFLVLALPISYSMGSGLALIANYRDSLGSNKSSGGPGSRNKSVKAQESAPGKEESADSGELFCTA